MSGMEFLGPLVGGVTALAGSALKPKAPEPAPPPKRQPVQRMPDPESPEVREARLREQRRIASERGRPSTDLMMGADTYLNETLGQ